MPLTGNIVIYGGSFNPPHMGHAAVCLWLTKALNASEVILVPTFDHPFKHNLEGFDYRIEMCKLMASGIQRVSVSDIEHNLPVPSRTINTLEQYKCSNLALVLGSDLIEEFRTWERNDEISKLAQIVVVGRTKDDIKIPDGWIYYPINLIGTSSKIIRKMIMDNLDVTGFVPKRVKRYIELNNLYK